MTVIRADSPEIVTEKSGTGQNDASYEIAAPVPPMGWNAWNAFRTDVEEAHILRAAQQLIDLGLARLGYQYVTIDDGWALRRKDDGKLEIRTSTFPSAKMANGETSFRPFVETLNSMGLKSGIYTDIGRNTCAQIWDSTRPNQPEGSQAEREVGAYGNEDQDMRLFFNDWGFDFIKIDACGVADYVRHSKLVANNTYRSFPQLIVRDHPGASDREQVEGLYAHLTDIAVSVNDSKKPIIAICAWGEVDVGDWASRYGQMWRTSQDIGKTWDSMLGNFDTAAPRALFAGPGRWNDPDLMQVGNADFGPDNLVAARTHFSLWSIIAAPLFLSLDLSKATAGILEIISNDEVIAVNQDPAGNQGVIIRKENDQQIIVKTLSDGSKAVTLTNRGDQPMPVTLPVEHLEFDGKAELSARDLWRRADHPVNGGVITTELGARETLMLRVHGQPLDRGIRRLSEMPARVRVTNPGYKPADRTTVDPWVAARLGYTPHGKPFIVNDIHDRNALVTAESARIEIDLNGEFRRFRAVPDQPGTILIVSEGHVLYRGDTHQVQPIDIAVEGVTRLEIIMPQAIAGSLARNTRALLDVALEF